MSSWGYGSATHTIGTVTTSSGTVLAANANRKYALLVNDSDANVYFALGGAAVANQGIRVNAGGGNYEMKSGEGEVYTGRIEAIHSSTGNKLVLVTEGT